LQIEEAIAVRNKELKSLKDLPVTQEDCFPQLILVANSICGKYKEVGDRITWQSRELDIRNKLYARLKQFNDEVRFKKLQFRIHLVFQ